MATNTLKSQNLRKIKSRFSALQRNEKRETVKIVKRVIKDAYDYAFELHDQMGLDLHFVRGGDFARAVVRDTNVVAQESTAGNGSPSLRTAEQAIVFDHIPNAPKVGILGVVAAGIVAPPGAVKYKVDHEYEVFDKLGQRAVDKALDAFHNMKLI